MLKGSLLALGSGDPMEWDTGRRCSRSGVHRQRRPTREPTNPSPVHFLMPHTSGESQGQLRGGGTCVPQKDCECMVQRPEPDHCLPQPPPDTEIVWFGLGATPGSTGGLLLALPSGELGEPYGHRRSKLGQPRERANALPTVLWFLPPTQVFRFQSPSPRSRVQPQGFSCTHTTPTSRSGVPCQTRGTPCRLTPLDPLDLAGHVPVCPSHRAPQGKARRSRVGREGLQVRLWLGFDKGAGRPRSHLPFK